MATLSRKLKLWNSRTGKLITSLPLAQPTRVLFAPNNKLLAVHDGSNLQLYDLEKKERQLLQSPRQDTIDFGSFTPDSKRFIVGGTIRRNFPLGGGRVIRIWDVGNGKQIECSAVTSTFLSPDGGMLAVCSNSKISFRNLVSDRRIVLNSFDIPSQMVFAQDGNLVAIRNNSGLSIWSLRDGEKILTLERSEWSKGEFVGLENSRLCGFLPDSQTLVTYYVGQVTLWDVSPENHRISYFTRRQTIHAMALSPDGKTLALAGGGPPPKKTLPFAGMMTRRGWIAFGDVLRKQQLWHLPIGKSDITDIAFAPNGKAFVAIDADGTGRLFQQDKVQFTVGTNRAAYGYGVAFAPDGKTFAIAYGPPLKNPFQPRTLENEKSVSAKKPKLTTGEVVVYDAMAGQAVQSLVVKLGAVRVVAFSPDGRLLALGIASGDILLCDADGGKTLAKLESQESSINALSFHPDGSFLAAGSARSGTIWDLSTNKIHSVLRCHTGQINCVTWTPDGKTVITGSSDRTIKCWDPVTGKARCTLSRHSYPVKTLVIGKGGNVLVSAGGLGKPLGPVVLGPSESGEVVYWNAASLTQELATLIEHEKAIESLSFSSDGKWLCTTSAEKKVCVWDAQTTRLHRASLRYASVTCHAVLGPGSQNLTVVSDRNVQIFELNTDKTKSSWELKDNAQIILRSGNGLHLLVQMGNSEIELWDLALRRQVTLKGIESLGSAAALSDDGQFLAVATDNDLLIVWNLFTGAKIATLTTNQRKISAVTFAPKGEVLVTGTEDGSLSTWSIYARKKLATFTDENTFRINSLSINAHEDLLASVLVQRELEFALMGVSGQTLIGGPNS